VQLAEKVAAVRRIVGHVGSAHTDAELAVPLEISRERPRAGQQVLDLRVEGAHPPLNTAPARSVLLAG
jgi:hypothetical protein